MSYPPRKLLIAIVEIHGGTGAFALNLADGFRQFFPGEFQIDLLTMRPTPVSEADSKRFDKIYTANMTVSEDWRRFFETIPNLFKLRRTLRQIDSDVILALHNFPNILIPFVAPRRRIIRTVHTHLSTLIKHNITRPFLKALIRNRYGHDEIIVPTRGVADDLAQNFNVTRTRIIPHGIDFDRINRLANEPVPDLPRKPYIVSLGRLTPAKDYPTLIDAYAQAVQKGLQHNLIIIGSGELERELKALVDAKGLSRKITFPGHRDNPYPYLKRADFFVLSSITESFGLALLEAMSLGLPIISTDTPGPAEILDRGTHGIMVPARDPASLATAMLELANSPQRRAELSELSRRRALDFSLEKMTRAYHDLFTDRGDAAHDSPLPRAP